jgi:hypothetical protein
MANRGDAESERGLLVIQEPDRQADWESWRKWVREDFLRYWFLCGVAAWDSLGALQIRQTLDPWHPNMDWSPPYVYVLMLAFVVFSTVAQVYLYLRWWPRDPDEAQPGLVRALRRRLRAFWNRLRQEGPPSQQGP